MAQHHVSVKSVISELFMAIPTDNSDNLLHTLLALNSLHFRLRNGVDEVGMDISASTATRGKDNDVDFDMEAFVTVSRGWAGCSSIIDNTGPLSCSTSGIRGKCTYLWLNRAELSRRQ